jgi:hypothetical protein
MFTEKYIKMLLPQLKVNKQINYNNLSIYLSFYGSTALCWALAAISVFFSYTQSVGLLGRGICPSQGLHLHTEYTHTDIHASSGIRTHDSSV